MFAGQSANDFYQEMLATIRLEGERAAPRGLPTTELLHAVTRIEDPRRRVLTQVGRKLNPFFNLAESLWIMTGQSEAEWICFYNSQLRKYLDPPLRYFHGAYGERLRHWPWVSRLGYGGHADQQDQLLNCYHILREAPESRQAVMILWSPLADKPDRITMDRPCNDAVTFKLRHNTLWMTVFNRSNDVILGLTSTNIVQFSTLQEVLATWLGADVGPYTHYSDSLHLYDSQDVPSAAPFDVYDYVCPTPMAVRPWDTSDLSLRELYAQAKMMQLAPASQLEAIEQNAIASNADAAWSGCPYWNSVGWALLAYAFHKQKAGVGATRCVERMKTPDWKVECLRFLADRYGDAEDFVGNATRIITGLPATGGLEGRQALWQYVFQSHPAVPTFS